MATLIPNDPRLRKTFTYQEQGWHTEHNRNWTETVEQINQHEDTLTTHAADIVGLDTEIDGIVNDLNTLQADIDTRLSASVFTSRMRDVSVGELTSTANSGATSIATSPITATLLSGDILSAYDLASGNTTPIILTADAPFGSTTLSVQALANEVTATTPITVDLRHVSSSLSVLDGRITSEASRISSLETTTTTLSTSLIQTADEITTLATRLTAAEQSTANGYTQIQQTADAVALKANLTTVNTLTGRVSAAESSISVNAGNITSLSSTVDTVNNNLITQTGRIDTNANGISALSTRTTSAENDISTLSSQLTIEQGRISTNIASINSVESSISTLGTRITQTESDIQLRASLSDVIDATSADSIALVDSATLDGSAINTIPCSPLEVALSSGDDVVVVNSDDLVATRCTVTSDVAVGATAIPVSLISLEAADESPIFLSMSALQSQLTVGIEGIEAIVSRNAGPSTAIGNTTAALTGGVTYSTIPVTRLDIDLVEDEQIALLNNDGDIVRFVVSDDISSTPGATNISVEAKTPTVTIPSGQHVFLPATNTSSKFSQVYDQITLEVGNLDVRSALNVELDNINVETYVFKSSNWNGTLDISDPNAVTIDSAGTTGWALTNGGEFNATGIFRSGAAVIDNRGLTINSTTGIDGEFIIEAATDHADGGLTGKIWGFSFPGSPSKLMTISVDGNGADLEFMTLDTTGTGNPGDIKFTPSAGAFSHFQNPTGNTLIKMPYLPTSDPGVTGQLWNDSGTVKVSAG